MKSLAYRSHEAVPALPPPSCSAAPRSSFYSSSRLFLGRAYFPRTDPGQFVINVKMPSGTRIEDQRCLRRPRWKIRSARSSRRTTLGMIVSNIGITPDLSAIYTPNASMDTAFVQVNLHGRPLRRQLRLHR